MNRHCPLMKPKRLMQGSRIGVVTPSEPVNDSDLDKGLEWLRAQGYDVVLGKHVRARNGHLAGADEDRSGDITAMFADKRIDAVFCSAGGANSSRLLSLLDYSVIASNPKVFLGLSDPTALLCAIHCADRPRHFSWSRRAVQLQQAVDTIYRSIFRACPTLF